MSNRNARLTSADQIASQLEIRRREIGWTVVVLAKQSGYSENTVLRVLHGDNVRWHTVQDIAKALDFNLVLISDDAS